MTYAGRYLIFFLCAYCLLLCLWRGQREGGAERISLETNFWGNKSCRWFLIDLFVLSICGQRLNKHVKQYGCIYSFHCSLAQVSSWLNGYFVGGFSGFGGPCPSAFKRSQVLDRYIVNNCCVAVLILDSDCCLADTSIRRRFGYFQDGSHSP